ncbi:MAG: 3-isopropylmalate dehydrogenase [Pseudomonadota bacterium]
MTDKRTLLLLPGDGIGPEVMGEVEKILDWFNTHRGLGFTWEEGLIGGACYDAHGVALTDATVDRAKQVDATLLGAVGGPKWDGVAYEHRPEAGLLRIRKELDLFANLRPAICFDALTEASSLKPDLVAGLDILIVRELTGGVYFGEPRGIEDLGGGERRGVNTQVYTTSEIRRLARVGYELARKRGGKVTSAEKSNVMESGLLWRQEAEKLHKEEYADLAYENMLADACAMQLVRAPKQFDVIITDNLFGDILSDEASMLTGSLGMLPSASLGEVNPATGKPFALYEPVHGSAPDIAGQGIANPLATVMSFAMALRYSFDLGEEADRLEAAVKHVLAEGLRTGDIMQPGMRQVGTLQMGEAIRGALQASL